MPLNDKGYNDLRSHTRYNTLGINLFICDYLQEHINKLRKKFNKELLRIKEKENE